MGKTTVSAAYASHRAARHTKKPLLLISTDPAHSLSDIFGQALADKPHRLSLAGKAQLDVWQVNAEQEFRAEAQLRPGSAEAAWRLGSVLLKKGQNKEALADLQRSDQLQPNMLDTLLDLGKAYLMENQIESAEKAFRRVIRIDDEGEIAAAAHLQLSQICRRLDRAEEADQHLKRFRELSKGPKPQ